MWSECSCAASSVVFACLLRDKWSRCEIASVFQVLTSTPTPALLQTSGLPYTTVMVRITCIHSNCRISLSFTNSLDLFRFQRVSHNQTILGWLIFLVFIREVDYVDLKHSAEVILIKSWTVVLKLAKQDQREFKIFYFATVTTLCSIHYSINSFTCIL